MGKQLQPIRALLGIAFTTSLKISVSEPVSEMSHVRNLQNLSRLILTGSSLRDEHLEPLSNLSYLNSIELRNTGIEGEGIRHLARLPSLQSIDLSDGAASETALKALRGNKTLRFAYLSDTVLTAKSADHLSTMSISHLFLMRCRLEPGSLEGLGTLQSLGRLHFGECSVDESTLQFLQRQMPKTHVSAK